MTRDHAWARPPQFEGAAVGFETPFGLHEEAQARRIDEPQRGQVDDHGTVALLGQIAEGRAQ